MALADAVVWGALGASVVLVGILLQMVHRVAAATVEKAVTAGAAVTAAEVPEDRVPELCCTVVQRSHSPETPLRWATPGLVDGLPETRVRMDAVPIFVRCRSSTKGRALERLRSLGQPHSCNLTPQPA